MTQLERLLKDIIFIFHIFQLFQITVELRTEMKSHRNVRRKLREFECSNL